MALTKIAFVGHLLPLFVITYLCLGNHVCIPSFQHRSCIEPGTSESVVGWHNCWEILFLVSPVHTFSCTEQIRIPPSWITIGCTIGSDIIGGKVSLFGDGLIIGGILGSLTSLSPPPLLGNTSLIGIIGFIQVIGD